MLAAKKNKATLKKKSLAKTLQYINGEMNDIEKLYDIEQDFLRMLKTGTYTIMPSDIRWLIEKVKELTRELEAANKE